MIMVAGAMCYRFSHRTMRGHFGVLRFHAILTALLGICRGVDPVPNFEFLTVSGGVAAFVSVAAVADTVYTWTVGDDKRRNESVQRRRLETRLLVLVSGAAVALPPVC